MPLIRTHLAARREAPAVVADGQVDRACDCVTRGHDLDLPGTGMVHGVVECLLRDQEQVAGHELRHVVGHACNTHRDLLGMAMTSLCGDRLERFTERSPRHRHGAEGPDRAAEFLGRVGYHLLGNVQMGRWFLTIALSTRPAGSELKIDAGERLQKRVVEVGGQPIALPQAGVEFQGCVAAAAHLGGESLGRRGDLPPQHPHPEQRPDEHGGQPRQSSREPAGRPPRRRAEHLHIRRRPQHQTELLDDRIGGHGTEPLVSHHLDLHHASHHQLAAGLKSAQRLKRCAVVDGGQRRLAARQDELTHARHRRFFLDQPGGKRHEAAVVVAGLGDHSEPTGLRVNADNLLRADRLSRRHSAVPDDLHDRVADTSDLSAHVEEARHLHAVAGLERRTGQGLHANAKESLLDIKRPSIHHARDGALGLQTTPRLRIKAIAGDAIERHERRREGRGGRLFDDHHVFGPTDPQRRCEKLPTAITDRTHHPGEANGRILELLGRIGERALRHPHLHPPGRRRNHQHPFPAPIADALHDAFEFDPSAVVETAEQSVQVCGLRLRDRSGADETHLLHENPRRIATAIQNAGHLHLIARTHRLPQAAPGLDV